MGKDFYEWIFNDNSDRWGKIGSHQGVDEAVNDTLKPYIGKNIKICDLGCGNGRTIYYIHRPEWEIWGVDYIAKAVEVANQTLAGKATVIQADMTKTPFADKSFDVVYSCGAFEHMDFPNFDEPYRILKDGGLFLATLDVGERGRVETEFCPQTGVPYWGKQWEWELPIGRWEELLNYSGFLKVNYSEIYNNVFICEK